MSTGKRLAAIGIGVILLVSACAPALPNSQPPWCDEHTVLVLEAQSVPSAQLVPCLESMPLGWEASFTWIDSDGSTVILDSDLAGDEAVEIELREACDVTGYVQVPSDKVGAKRYELIENIMGDFRGRRIYLFEGGCMTLTFHFDAEASAALVNEVSRTVGLIPRSTIDEEIRSATNGRERLDPPGG